MENTETKRHIYTYTFWVSVLGFFFPFLGWIIDAFAKDETFSFVGIAKLHLKNPVHWVLDSAPIILGFVSYFIIKSLILKSEKVHNDLETEIIKAHKIFDFTEKLRIGDIETNYDIYDDSDEIGKSLVQLRDNLKKNKEEELDRRKEDAQRHWATEGLAKFGEILRKYNDNMEELSYHVITNLVKYLNVIQGGFFIIRDEEEHKEKYFELIASHAYDRKKFCDKHIAWGEGLVGVCALERNTIFMKQVTDSYVNITSGLGQSNPRCILIVPLKSNDEVQGVIEFASFRILEQFEVEFVEKVAESIASTIASYKINAKTARLLMDSRKQAEQLSRQEEFVRHNLEELKQTQQEAAKQSEQFISFTNAVNHTLIRAEYDTKGVLLYANSKFLKKLGYTRNSEVEGKNISMFINKKDREWFNKIWDGLVKGGPHFEGDMKHVTKQGKDLWTMATYVSIRNQEGKPHRILFLGIDTTDQKKASLDFEGQINALDNSSVKAEFTHESKIFDCNEKFLHSLNYENLSEIKGKTVYDLLDKEDIREFTTIWNKIIGGTPYEGQIRYFTKDGIEKWFNATYSVVHDMYGEIAKVILIANEITEQKRIEFTIKQQTEQLKVQEEKLRLNEIELSKKLKQTREEMKLQFKEIETVKMLNEKTLHGLLDAVVTINNRNVVVFFNKAAEQIWGYEKEDVIGKNIILVLPNEYSDKDDGFLGNFFKNGNNEIIGKRTEVFIINKFGDKVSVLVTISEAQYASEYNLTAFIQNIEVELF